jgi:hypothetical protein
LSENRWRMCHLVVGDDKQNGVLRKLYFIISHGKTHFYYLLCHTFEILFPRKRTQYWICCANERKKRNNNAEEEKWLTGLFILHRQYGERGNNVLGGALLFICRSRFDWQVNREGKNWNVKLIWRMIRYKSVLVWGNWISTLMVLLVYKNAFLSRPVGGTAPSWIYNLFDKVEFFWRELGI